jgi:DNA-directed RNA polymerase specialized sigma subunit
VSALRWDRIGPSRVPPNWSARDWLEEVRALGAAAAWQARSDYDPARGVPLDAFVHQRVLSRIRTRYRQELSYAAHCGRGRITEAAESRSGDSSSAPRAHEALRGPLARLSECDRWLIERLFWDGWTEARVAREWGVSQQAVSKRKWAILFHLRISLGGRDEEP